jgi:hypothetical protein
MYCKRKREPVRREYCSTAGVAAQKGFLSMWLVPRLWLMQHTAYICKIHTYIAATLPGTLIIMKGMGCAHYTTSSYIPTYVHIICHSSASVLPPSPNRMKTLCWIAFHQSIIDFHCGTSKETRATKGNNSPHP